MSNNKDPTKKNDNKNNKTIIKNINLILDPSKSLLLTKLYPDYTNNQQKTPLHNCKQEIFPTIKKPEHLTKNNLNINNNEFNMTINNILNSMKERRENNKKKYYKKLSTITNRLDNDKSLDLSNNQLVTYKPENDKKNALDTFLASLNEKSKK